MATKYNILFVLDSEPDKPDARIRCRVRWSGKTCAFSVGYRVDKSKWIAEAQRCKNNTTHGKKKIPASQINAEIQRFEDTLNDIFIKSDADLNVEQLRTEFTQRIGRVTADDKRHNLFDDYATFIREEGSENKWSDGTYKKHRTVMRHLKDFSPLLTYNDLDENGLNAFSNFLLNNAGLRNGTVRKTISVTKWFLKWATRKGLNNQSAYLSYRSKLKTVPIDKKEDDEQDRFNVAEVPCGKCSPEESSLNSELHCIIERSIHKLPESFRLAIVLREFQGLSYEEIAELTKTNVGTVKSRIARARNKLQEDLKEYIA